jgi:hypothetical protein
MDLLSRRAFGGKTGRWLLAGTAAAFLSINGCAVLVGALAHYIPIINGAISTIEKFFGAALPPGVSAIIDTVKAILADIGTACSDYQKADPATKATLLGKIEVFLKGVVDGFQQILDNFGSLGPVPAIVLGVINIVISTLEWLVGKFSKAATTRMLMPMQVRMTARMGTGSQYMVIVPIQRNENQFKAEINSLMASNGRSDIAI